MRKKNNRGGVLGVILEIWDRYQAVIGIIIVPLIVIAILAFDYAFVLMNKG